MNEEKFRTLRERLLESLEEYREIGDQEIYQRIDELLLDDSMEHYMRLAERYALRKELFNSIRRLDILQELLEDDTITEIMVNGTDGIFIERYGRLTRWEKCFGSAEKLQDIAQQIVGRCNRIVNEAVPIVDARLEHGEREYCDAAGRLKRPCDHDSSLSEPGYPDGAAGKLGKYLGRGGYVTEIAGVRTV